LNKGGKNSGVVYSVGSKNLGDTKRLIRSQRKEDAGKLPIINYSGQKNVLNKKSSGKKGK